MKERIIKSGIVLFILLALTILNYSGTANAQWSPTSGISGGFVLCMASSGSNLYAGTYGYGIYKSTNNGANWVASSTGLDYVQSNYIRSIVVSGSNLIVGTYFGIYYSTNNGDNWNVADTILTKSKTVGSLTTVGTSGYVFAGTSTNPAAPNIKTTFVSTNNGVTWAETTTNPQFTGSNVAIYSMVEFGTGTLYTGTNHGVFRSLNYGATWTQMGSVSLGDKIVYSLAAYTTTKLLAGTSGNGVYSE